MPQTADSDFLDDKLGWKSEVGGKGLEATQEYQDYVLLEQKVPSYLFP